ncbi:unnamed protein product [Strongylus vulgaris]|uniref:Uncharacterized protein n=1 Tax=Strongylus vulgaris TaxID=40348 RepID=A0A3P7KW43_STRVU|nr:unnamed protein product [Strongylus vulgaris]
MARAIFVTLSPDHNSWFQSCCGRVASLLRDATHVFSSRPLARIFAHAQDTLSGVADCPFLFVTAQYVRYLLSSFLGEFTNFASASLLWNSSTFKIVLIRTARALGNFQ